MSRRRRRGATKVRDLRVRGPWAAVIQCSAFVRKELAEIIRQPRLILLLIVGPFALLVLFGMGYRSENLGLRTMFVGPPDSFYEEAIAKYENVLERFVDPRGYTSDESAARQCARRRADPARARRERRRNSLPARHGRDGPDECAGTARGARTPQRSLGR